MDPECSSGDESTQEGGFLVDSTGIEMYSVSDEPTGQSEENIPMSSQEQTMNLTGTGADDHHKELKARGNVSPDHIRTVDLDKDNVPEFSLEKSPADEGLVPAKVVLGFSGDSASVKQRISGDFLDGTRSPACGVLVDNVAERSGDSALRKNLGLLKQIFEEIVSLESGGVGGDIPVGTESVDAGFKETATKEVSLLKAADKEPGSRVRRGKEVGSSPEEGSRKKRRELSASIGGLMENAAKGLVPDSSSSENQSLLSLMDTVTKLSGEKNSTGDPGNVDILETLQQRGMTFPRPRWWPPEGF